MKRNLLFLFTFLLITSCNHNANIVSKENITDISLSDLTSILIDASENEVEYSSKVISKEVENRGDFVTKTKDETLNIYNNNITSGVGSVSLSDKSSGTEEVKSDTYEYLAKEEYYGNDVDVVYFIYDYADGTLSEEWKDKGTRLPIVDSATEGEEGSDYLLKSSLANQLTKQVALLTKEFISTYLINNADISVSLPDAKLLKNENSSTYYLDSFSYSVEDEDITNTYEFSFSFKIEDGLFVSSRYEYKSTSFRDESDFYIIDLVNSYDISYENRVNADENSIIKPTDYFVESIEEVSAFTYSNDNFSKTYLDLNKLEIGNYVGFEAKKYSPNKAIDLSLTPINVDDETVVSISGSVLECLSVGTVKVTLEAVTGATIEIEITVVKPNPKEISIGNTDLEKEDNKYVAYLENTYSLYVNIRPLKSSLALTVKVSDPSQISVSQDSYSNDQGYIIYSLKVADTLKTNKVTITFTSKIDNNISETIEINIKEFSEEDRKNYMISHSYQFNHLYTAGFSAVLTFTETVGTIVYSYNGETHTTSFDYKLEKKKLIISNLVNPNPFNTIRPYDEADITYDCTRIDFWYNDTEIHDIFYAVE